MDALSDLLAVTSVRGSLFSRAELTSPWGVSTRGAGAAIFHVVVEGSGWIEVEGGGTAQPFRSGELLLLPHGSAHVLRDAPSGPAVPIRELPSKPGVDGLPCLMHGGGGPRTSILCGTFRFGPDGGDFLLPLLPRLIHAKGGGGGMAAWMDSTLRMLADETMRSESGSQLLIARLSEVLFIQALRSWAKEAGDEKRGLLGALADPRLARALGLMHREPARAWSVPALASQVGLSRSAFFERFNRALGETPLAYLTRWRMVLARSTLRREDLSLTQVAEQVGYVSEAAFSRAFKRHVGATPALWRRQLRHAATAPVPG